MITLPLKKSEPAKLSEHIAPVLAQVYPVGEFRSELEAIDKLRVSALGVAANAAGRDLLFRYFVQLELLSLHVPTSPFRTEFAWHDLYSRDTQRQSSLAFEKAAVLYNLAAVLGGLGAEACAAQDYKSAYHDFCCAAGVLDFISTSFLHAASIDVQPATVAVLSKLMLAQAQHCFFLKAAFPAQITSKPNRALLAKLGAAACSLYGDAESGLQKLYDEEHWGDRGAFKQLEDTVKELRAQTYHCQAKHHEEKHEYGAAIACLQEARRLASDRRDAEETSAQIKVLEKDNDLIYHERVPATVPVIGETVTAKPLPISAVYATQEEASKVAGRDLFERVVPIKVHEKASLYTEMTTQFVRDQQEKADIANLELASALEYMDLPASISRLRASTADLTQVPPEVLEYSAEVRRSPLTEQSFQFDDQRRKILAFAQANKDPTGPPSTVRENLVLAGKTDQELLAMFRGASADFDRLRNLDGLVQSYKDCVKPDISLLDLDSSTADLDGELDKVSALVAKLQKIRAERQSTLTDLRDKVRNDDITQAIVAHQDAADVASAVFEPELRKFDPLVRRLDATVRLQKSVLNEAVAAWKALLASPAAKKRQEEQRSAQEAFDKLTSQLSNAFYTFEAAREGAANAAAFYASLEKQALGVSAPQRPPKIPPKRADGLSGYDTPSAYNPSMYG